MDPDQQQNQQTMSLKRFEKYKKTFPFPINNDLDNPLIYLSSKDTIQDDALCTMSYFYFNFTFFCTNVHTHFSEFVGGAEFVLLCNQISVKRIKTMKI